MEKNSRGKRPESLSRRPGDRAHRTRQKPPGGAGPKQLRVIKFRGEARAAGQKGERGPGGISTAGIATAPLQIDRRIFLCEAPRPIIRSLFYGCAAAHADVTRRAEYEFHMPAAREPHYKLRPGAVCARALASPEDFNENLHIRLQMLDGRNDGPRARVCR